MKAENGRNNRKARSCLGMTGQRRRCAGAEAWGAWRGGAVGCVCRRARLLGIGGFRYLLGLGGEVGQFRGRGRVLFLGVGAFWVSVDGLFLLKMELGR